MTDDAEEPRKRTGYRNPPDKHKFKKGKSGNPKGRPRKPTTAFQQIESVLLEPISVTIEGRRQKLTRQEIMLLALANKAMKGDLRSAQFLFNSRDTYRDSEAVAIDPKDLAPEDYEILRDHVRRYETRRSADVGGETPALNNLGERDG